MLATCPWKTADLVGEAAPRTGSRASELIPSERRGVSRKRSGIRRHMAMAVADRGRESCSQRALAGRPRIALPLPTGHGCRPVPATDSSSLCLAEVRAAQHRMTCHSRDPSGVAQCCSADVPVKTSLTARPVSCTDVVYLPVRLSSIYLSVGSVLSSGAAVSRDVARAGDVPQRRREAAGAEREPRRGRCRRRPCERHLAAGEG